MGDGFARRTMVRIAAVAQPKVWRFRKVVTLGLGIAALMGAALGAEAVRQWQVAPQPALAPSAMETYLSGPSVVRDAATGRLMMWYWASYTAIGTAGSTRRAIGLATSNDGKTWTRHAGNPLFADDATWPGVLYDAQAPPEQRFKIWYNVFPGPEIRYSWSADGVSWQGQVTAIEKGPPGESDDLNVAAPCVLRGGDGQYMMYYDAGSSSVTERAGYPHNHYLALAVSGDGVHWTRRGVVLARGGAGEWDGGRVYNAWVIYDPAERLYEMWYAGKPAPTNMAGSTVGGIGYAVSLDGIKWVKSPRNPDLPSSPRSEGLDRVVGPPTVLKDAQGYHMWFDGDRQSIAYAELPPDAYREEHQALTGSR